MTSRIARGTAGLLAVLILGFAGFLAYIGYFGGPVFTDVPATGQAPAEERGTAAVLLSGDMGFRIGMGPLIAARLARDGIPVVGVNSLTYFRHRRTPEEAGRLVLRAMQQAMAVPGTRRVVLIGQSFGADMLHVGLAKLPRPARANIAFVALVVPSDTVEFQASPEELFDLVPPDGPALPTARRLDWVPVLCVHGAREPHSLCPIFRQANVAQATLPGGHELNGDDAALYRVLAQAMRGALARTSLSNS